MEAIRNNWTQAEVAEIYHLPLLDLIYQAASTHRTYQKANEVQVCTLLSIKTGGCPENCAYCPQSAHYDTSVEAEKLMDVERVIHAAKTAKDEGATRFCMGAAWRQVKDNQEFERVLTMVKEVNTMGLEVCCTLGMVTENQAQRLKAAGLHAYNHNLDTGPEFYGQIITTRTYQDRLQTLENVRKAGITVCCGGIIGMGETDKSRINLLHTLATLPEHPESVPINALVAVEGTPLAEQTRVSVWDMVRMIATARIIMPRAMVRLSAGRVHMSQEEQALCFLAGANSIFSGDKLLTTTNNDVNADNQMFQLLGLTPRPSAKVEMVA